MTELNFRCPERFLPETLLRRAFFASWGRIPKPSRVRLHDGVLSVFSEGLGSGSVHVPCPHHRLGLSLESTETLLPREQPYHLVKELARGSLGKIMRRLYEWQMFGFRPSDSFREAVRQMIARFAVMATTDENATSLDQSSQELLVALDALILRITDEFTEQSLAWRMRNGSRLPVMLGVGMTTHGAPESIGDFAGYAPTLNGLFDAIAPIPPWREIEPEQGVFRWDLVEERLSIPARYGFQIIAGPLIEFDQRALPTWLIPRLNEEDFLEICVAQFIEAFVERFEYIVDRWILSTRFNSHALPGVPIFRGFSIIRATAAFVRAHSPDKTIMVGVDQPWGDYGLRNEPQFGLVNIGEALMTCHEVDAFLLELNFGLESTCSLPRDPMWLGPLIDHWSFLGKKVFVSFSVPSGLELDLPQTKEATPSDTSSELWNNHSQAEWVVTVMRMLLSKRSVQGVFWSSLQDPVEGLEDTRVFGTPLLPYSGLIDTEHEIKPACYELQALREAYLQ